MDKEAQQMVAFGLMFCLIAFGVGGCAIMMKNADIKQSIELSKLK